MGDIAWNQATDIAMLLAMAFMAGSIHGQRKQIALWQERTEVLGMLLMDTLEKLNMMPEEIKRHAERSET